MCGQFIVCILALCGKCCQVIIVKSVHFSLIYIFIYYLTTLHYLFGVHPFQPRNFLFNWGLILHLLYQYQKSHIINKRSMDPFEFPFVPFDIEAYKRQSEIEERYIFNLFRKKRKQIEEGYTPRVKRKYLNRDSAEEEQNSQAETQTADPCQPRKQSSKKKAIQVEAKEGQPSKSKSKGEKGKCLISSACQVAMEIAKSPNRQD